ncbi:hypothetical protein K443DRAFT_98801, partial [Laccaria amethystina LaAM-08-1]
DVKTWWACLLILLGYLPPDQLAATACELTIDEIGSSGLRSFNAITDTAATLRQCLYRSKFQVLDLALINGSRSVSLLDIAAPVGKQIKTFNSWDPTHRGTRIGQMLW